MLRRKMFIWLSLTAIFISAFLPCQLYGKRVEDKDLFSDDAEDVVYFVPQFSDFKEISYQDMLFIKKILKKAARNNVKAVVVELDTPGGKIDVALKYVSIFSKSKVPVIVFLNPQGISAGMIIAMAANRIAINPHGVIGDAMPIQIRPGGVKPITDEPEEHSEKNKKEKKKSENKKDKDSGKEETENGKKEPTLKRILKELQKVNKQNDTEKYSEKDKKLANQKFLTVFFKVLQVLAEKNDRPVRVIRAMADPYQKLSLKEDGIKHTKVSPLTLSAEEAKKLKVVDYICKNRQQVLDKLGIGNCEINVVKKNPLEQILAFLAHPLLAGALITLGVIGIYVEIKTPGFGVPGALGITALTLFFLGHTASGASDWGPIVIFFVGMILLMLEIFVIPGFGVVGVLGILCVIISLFGAFGFENFSTAANVIGLSFLVALTLMVLLTIYVLPNSSLYKHLKLTTQQKSSQGFSAPHQDKTELIGKHGTTLTHLRPAGVVVIDEERYDASTEGDYIEKDKEVEVVSLNGFQIKVKKV